MCWSHKPHMRRYLFRKIAAAFAVIKIRLVKLCSVANGILWLSSTWSSENSASNGSISC